jgi:AraC family transcriptional regulator of adaptative response/methylated-DNA-[protein]-cysteine methyltransferase
MTATRRAREATAAQSGPATAAEPDRDAARRAAVARRDPSADGDFVYAVGSTGIFCRPSCPSRPKVEAIGFFADPGEAIAAGYRACRRCRPERFVRPADDHQR